MQQVVHPLVNLVQLLRELVSLPLPLVVHLQRLSQSFPNLHPGAVMEPDPRFHYQLNNAMRAAPILACWGTACEETFEQIATELSRRLNTTSALVDALRKMVPERLFAWPRKFVFPRYREFHHLRLSRLEFVLRYESFLRALETREGRARPLPERMLAGITISLVLTERPDVWRVTSRLEAASFDSREGYWTFLLAPPSLEGERAQMSWDDYRRRNHHHVPPGPVRLARVLQVAVDERSGLVLGLRLELKGHSEQPHPSAGDRFYLHPRYSDFTSEPQARRLQEEDDSRDSLLLRLLDQPTPLGDAVPEVSSPMPGGLTASQQAAWRNVCRSRLTLVWGPPGTGKTHFLASCIGALAGGETPLRVAVCAFTHSAVENLLEKLATSFPEVVVCKLGELKKPSDKVRSLDPADARYQKTGTVMGGTVYKLTRGWKGRRPDVDVLVVDEGSQLKWGELALALPVLRPGGRLIIAGDDLQLPPIIAGSYPAPEDGLPGLEDSCFAYLRARDTSATPYTCQLTENWRMHRTLSAFAAESLYGERYQPATDEIAERRLSLTPAPAHPLDALLDPDYPLVVCVLEDVLACQENLVEAGLVAQLALAIRERLQSDCDDEQFWRDELFVVSPHHLQIRAILRELRKGREWSCAPFVDTVDKMQGQEARAVIVSYGVSDTETALQEASFIYSLNRLNVAITRAQAKCIVFLPRPLLQARFEVLEDDKAARGLGHMNALLAFCAARGERIDFFGPPWMTVWRA